jgi:O-antigen/teichoic acid export membrane protein
MFQRLVRLTRHSAVYGAGYLLNKGISILLLPVHTHFLDTGEYGIATQLFAVMAIAQMFFACGLNIAFMQFFGLEKDTDTRKVLVSTALAATATVSLFCSVVFIASGPFLSIRLLNTQAYVSLFAVCAGILVCDTLALIPLNILRVEERPLWFVSAQLGNAVLNIGLNALFVGVLKWGVKGVFWANLASSGFVLIVMTAMIARYLTPRFSTVWLKKMFRFGLPIVPSMLGLIAMETVDRFLIKRYCGLEAAGVYGAVFKLSMIINLIIVSFRYAWHPFFVVSSKEPDANQMFSRILTYFSMICGALFLAISVWIDRIAGLHLFGLTLLNERYAGGLPLVPIIVLSRIVYGFYLQFSAGIYLSEKTKHLPGISLSAAAFQIGLDIFLISRIGLAGAAWSALAGLLYMTAATAWVSRRVYPIPYEWKKIAGISSSTGAAYAVIRFIPTNFHDWAGLVTIVCLMLFFYGFILERKEKDKIKGWLRMI